MAAKRVHAAYYARAILATVCLSVMCVCCTADTQQPIVAIDEFHLNYLLLSPAATWRLTTLRDELVAAGYAVRAIDDLISPAELYGCSVLIVTTPQSTGDYDVAELSAIQSFAAAGGGVLVCSNYTSQVQPLTTLLGFSLHNDTATDATHNAEGYDRWVTLTGSCIASHPVTAGVGTLQCYSTSTLAASANVTSLAATDSDASPPLTAVAQARAYGAGRVIVCGSPLYLADPVPHRDIGGGRYADMLGITAADNRRFVYNAITWLAGATGRPLVTMSLSKSVGASGDTIDVLGTVCDAGLIGYVLEYRPASGSGAWTQVGPVHTSSVVNGKLGEWNLAGVAPGDYTLRVTATNSVGGSASASATVHVAALLDRISNITATPDGAYVKLVDKEVTIGSADLVGSIYVEEGDRSAGICVLTSAEAPRGGLATITGIHNVSGASHTITAVTITTRPRQYGGPIAPIGVGNSAIRQVGAGATPVGLLIKTWGVVVGANNDGFVITDGSSVQLEVLTGCARSAITVPPAGSTVAVVGAGATYQGGAALVARESAQVLGVP